MECAKCGGRLGVVDTYTTAYETIRKRRCKKCGAVIFTSEMLVDEYTGHELVAERWRKGKKSK